MVALGETKGKACRRSKTGSLGCGCHNRAGVVHPSRVRAAATERCSQLSRLTDPCDPEPLMRGCPAGMPGKEEEGDVESAAAEVESAPLLQRVDRGHQGHASSCMRGGTSSPGANSQQCSTSPRCQEGAGGSSKDDDDRMCRICEHPCRPAPSFWGGGIGQHGCRPGPCLAPAGHPAPNSTRHSAPATTPPRAGFEGDTGDADNPLISPCLCSGGSSFIHRQCLQQWRLHGNRTDSFYKCPTCGYRYEYRRRL